MADGDPLAVALRQVPPRGSRAAHPQQGVDERVVVDRHVAVLSRQRMCDPHEPVRRDVIPRRTHTTIITQNLNRVNTPLVFLIFADPFPFFGEAGFVLSYLSVILNMST